MEIIPVKTGRAYEVTVGHGCADAFYDQLAARHRGKRAAIVTDETVDGLYGESVRRALEGRGIPCCKFAFPGGEPHKRMETALAICESLHREGITRSDFLVALGGGIPGDVTGFCAAVYLRGVEYVQIPTTLLAQIDSSVGGKTAVNIDGGKNLVGCFWQPSAVLCDTAFFDTLPEEVFADGVGAAIKYGAIRDAQLFEQMRGDFRRNLLPIVARCIAIKAAVVEADERDTGERMVLNFGHTLGHAIEKHSGFAVTHGKAVAIGMQMMADACAQNGLCAPEVPAAIRDCLQRNGLAWRYDAPLEELLAIAAGDKKRDGMSISPVLIRAIGRCEPVSMEWGAFAQFMAAGGSRA